MASIYLCGVKVLSWTRCIFLWFKPTFYFPNPEVSSLAFSFLASCQSFVSHTRRHRRSRGSHGAAGFSPAPFNSWESKALAGAEDTKGLWRALSQMASCASLVVMASVGERAAEAQLSMLIERPRRGFLDGDPEARQLAPSRRPTTRLSGRRADSVLSLLHDLTLNIKRPVVAESPTEQTKHVWTEPSSFHALRDLSSVQDRSQRGPAAAAPRSALLF